MSIWTPVTANIQEEYMGLDSEAQDRQIKALGRLENSLWEAFKQAEKDYIPPVFNLWKVTAIFWRLRKAGHLKAYEYFPFYGLIAVVTAGMATVGRQHWLLVVYLLSLVPTFVFMGRYVSKFALAKAKMLDLQKSCFGVAHLPLLTYGMKRIHAEAVSSKGNTGAATLTRENLSSLIKLVKGSHEHGEISTGFGDFARKWVFGASIPVVGYLYGQSDQVRATYQKVLSLAAKDLRVPAVGFLLLVFALYLGFQLIFAPANQKRQKRRYLLALNTLCETWQPELTEIPVVSVSRLEHVKAAA